MTPGKNHIPRTNATPDHAGADVFRRDHVIASQRVDNVFSIGGPRKCMPRAEERCTKADLAAALKRNGLDGHRQASFAAYWIGVAPSTLHGWCNEEAKDRLPWRRALARLDEWGRDKAETQRFLRVVGAK